MKELIQIQSKLKAPKNQFNKFGNYRYRSAEDILESVKPLLAETQCTLILSDKIIEVAGRVYVEATAKLINSEGVTIETSASAREEETKKGCDCAQITGMASSYARKYALNGLFCIDDTRDADATNTHGKEDSKEDPEIDMSRVVQRVYECENLSQLTALWNNFKQYETADKPLSKAIAKRRKELGI